MISPSRLMTKACGLPLEGTHFVTESMIGERCAVCGDTLRTGEPVDELNLPPSFTNHASLAIPGGEWRCGACTSVMTRSVFQMAASTVIFSEEGVFPIVKKEHRAWAFMTPPEGPFAICVQNAKQQHVVWRAPVSLSKENILVRVGEQVLRIRRQVLMNARAEAIHLDGLKRAQGRPTKDGYENPFYVDWKLQSVASGDFKSWLNTLLFTHQISPKDIPAILSLNGAEAWALGAVLHDNPVKPEPITNLAAA